jgi:hypothetical protein
MRVTPSSTSSNQRLRRIARRAMLHHGSGQSRRLGCDRKDHRFLYGSDYWNEIINFKALVRHGMIAPEDLELFAFADDPESAMPAAGRARPRAGRAHAAVRAFEDATASVAMRERDRRGDLPERVPAWLGPMLC